MALRRQAGADTVDLDTQAGYAKYVLRAPRTIDFVKVEQAARGAGYTLKGMEVEVRGRVDEGRCESCQKDVFFLTLDDTGQMIELDGEIPSLDHQVRVRGAVSGWAEKHVIMKVLETIESD